MATPADWFWEGNVQQAVVAHVRADGWTIERTADTASRQRGIDVVAGKEGRRLAIEVKGFPSTTYARGPKAGQPKPTAPTLQARHWFAEAVMAALVRRSEHPEVELALALPDMPRYRALLDATRWALEELGIGVYLVAMGGEVDAVIEHRPPAGRVRGRPRVYVPARGTADWRALLGNPKTQWRAGYSARALAESWQAAQDFPPEVRNALRDAPQPLRDLELLLAIPEHRVTLPGGAASSQTDLYVLARGSDGLVAIAVEGKVEESFDDTVADWLDKRAADEERRGRERKPSTGAEARLRHLCQLLELDGDVGGLYYQLLHRAASAVLEGQRFGAGHALMLVHSFSATHRWHGEYVAFAKRFGAVRADVGEVVAVGRRGGVELYLGWVSDGAR